MATPFYKMLGCTPVCNSAFYKIDWPFFNINLCLQPQLPPCLQLSTAPYPPLSPLSTNEQFCGPPAQLQLIPLGPSPSSTLPSPAPPGSPHPPHTNSHTPAWSQSGYLTDCLCFQQPSGSGFGLAAVTDSTELRPGRIKNKF